MPGIAIGAAVHADLACLAREREVGIGALAEEILAKGIARKRADSERHKSRKAGPRGAAINAGVDRPPEPKTREEIFDDVR